MDLKLEDSFFKQLYLNRYICLEDWINKENIREDECKIKEYINISFDINTYFDNENYEVLDKHYKNFEKLNNEILDLSKQIKEKVDSNKTSDVHIEKFKQLMEQYSRESEINYEEFKRDFENLTIHINNNTEKNVDEDLLKLLSEYKKKIEKKDMCFQKLYCLFFYKKVSKKISGIEKTYIYYSNGEKPFIVTDFFVFQKLVKYLDDKKDEVQTDRNKEYLRGIEKSIKKIGKYFADKEVSLEYPLLDTPQAKEELLRIIELINFRTIKKSDKNTLFYRGHSDSNYSLVPSIIRNDKIIKNEHNYYHETIVRCNDFFLASKHRLEILTLMQHYSIPTRLLDISKNPLSALYFAVGDKNSFDGEIIIFCGKENEIKYYHSDTVEILATLSVLHYDEKQELEKLVIKLTKELVKKISDKGNEILEERLLDEEIEKVINSFNQEYIVKKLVHEIAKRNSHFQPNINPFQLFNSYFVLPILNNSRIVRQSGAFMITGFNTKVEAQRNIHSHRYHWRDNFDEYNQQFIDEIQKDKLIILEEKFEISEINKKEFLKKYGLFKKTLNREVKHSKKPEKLKKVRIIIHCKDNKKEYSDWLNTFDINQATVYPEIEKVGAYLNSKYNI